MWRERQISILETWLLPRKNQRRGKAIFKDFHEQKNDLTSI